MSEQIEPESQKIADGDTLDRTASAKKLGEEYVQEVKARFKQSQIETGCINELVEKTLQSLDKCQLLRESVRFIDLLIFCFLP